jgi:hypothetical protein
MDLVSLMVENKIRDRIAASTTARGSSVFFISIPVDKKIRGFY